MITNICYDIDQFDDFYSKHGKRFGGPDNQKIFFKEVCATHNIFPMTVSKFQARQKVIRDIYSNNIDNVENVKELHIMVCNYYTSKSTIERQNIRYGAGAGENYSNKLKKVRETTIRPHHLQYWIDKGYNVIEAQRQRCTFLSNHARTRSSKRYEKWVRDPSSKTAVYDRINKTKAEKRNIEYWLEQGYSMEDSYTQIAKYIPPKVCRMEFIKKYGEVCGNNRYEQILKKRKDTRIKKFGTTMVHSHVSKSSLRYFIKLYKILRKMGICKEDIMWGIGDRREFTTKDNNTNLNYAYDFVIRSKKIVIEFNDPFWHPRAGTKWKNPFVDRLQGLKKDKIKKKLVEKLKFKLIYVWSDYLPSPEFLASSITL